MPPKNKVSGPEKLTEDETDAFIEYNNKWAIVNNKKESSSLWEGPTLTNDRNQVLTLLASFLATPEIVESENYSCQKCGSRRMIITRVQTRAADEPETTFMECASCHNSYRE